MTDVVAQALGLDLSDDDVKLGVLQARKDSHWLRTLIKIREAQQADVEQFAAKLGVSRDELLDFEADPLSFDLPFVRMYATTLGALVTHQVYAREHVTQWILRSDYTETTGEGDEPWLVDVSWSASFESDLEDLATLREEVCA